MFNKTVSGDYGTARIEQTEDSFWVFLNGTPLVSLATPHQALIFATKVANQGY